jgi:hypothetical protein
MLKEIIGRIDKYEDDIEDYSLKNKLIISDSPFKAKKSNIITKIFYKFFSILFFFFSLCIIY